MSGADPERACVEQLFKSGHKVILCDESKERVPGERYRALDMELDGRMMDIRSITGRNKWYTHALLSKNSQLKSYNARGGRQDSGLRSLPVLSRPFFFQREIHAAVNKQIQTFLW